MFRVQAREPERRLTAASVPEWLIAKTTLRSITGRPTMSLMTVSAVTLPDRESLVLVRDHIDAAVDHDRRGVDGDDRARGPQSLSGVGVQRDHGPEAGG